VELHDAINRRDMGLTSRERKTAIEALRRVQSLPIGVAGPRAEAVRQRFVKGNTAVNLIEFNTLGLALSRLDTLEGYALLNKLKNRVLKGVNHAANISPLSKLFGKARKSFSAVRLLFVRSKSTAKSPHPAGPAGNAGRVSVEKSEGSLSAKTDDAAPGDGTYTVGPEGMTVHGVYIENSYNVKIKGNREIK
jgi:hypothetical protein